MDTTPGSAQQSLEKSLPIAIKPLSGLGGGGGGGGGSSTTPLARDFARVL